MWIYRKSAIVNVHRLSMYDIANSVNIDGFSVFNSIIINWSP